MPLPNRSLARIAGWLAGWGRAIALAALMLGATPLWAESVHREVLGSGLTVVIEEHHSTAAVEVRVAVRAAPLYEGPLLGSGASLLLQRLLVTSGQSDLPADELRRTIAALGNHFAASTEVGYSTYALSTTGEHTGEGLALIAGMLANYAYTAADLQRERPSLLAQAGAPPGLGELLAGTLYRVHPARLPLAGLPRMMEQLTVELMRRYQAARYTAANTVVTVVGNVNTDEVRRLVELAFAKYPIGGFQAMPVPEESVQVTPRFASGRGTAATPRVLLAWRTEAMQHPDLPALLVLAQALGDENRGLLRRALPAGPAADLAVEAALTVDQPGWFSIAFSAGGAERAGAEQAVRASLGEVAARGVPADDLEAAKRACLRQLAAGLGGVDGIADELTRWELAAGDPAYGDVFRERIDALAVEDLQRVARRYLAVGGDARTCTVVLRAEREATDPTPGAAAPTTAVPPNLIALGHGVRALVRQVDEAPLVHIQVTLGGGAAADPEGQPGLTAMLVATMVRGSEGHPASALERLLGARGMTLAATTAPLSAGFAIDCLPDDVDSALEIAVDLVTRPELGQEELDAARGALARQIDAGARQWDRRLLADLDRVVFAGAPGLGDPLGRKEGLAAIDRAAVAAQYRRLAVGANTVLSVTGRCEAVRVGERLEQLLRAQPLPSGKPPTAATPAFDPSPPPLTVASAPGSVAAVAMAWRAPGPYERGSDEAPLAVISALLAGVGQPGGRINQALLSLDQRPRLGAAREAIADRALWVLYGQVDPAALDATERVAREQIAALVRQLALAEGDPQGLSDAELGAAKATCITALTLAQEDQAQVAARQAAALLAGGDPAAEVDLAERVRAVTAGDLARISSGWLTGDAVVLVQRPRDDGVAEGPGGPAAPAQP